MLNDVRIVLRSLRRAPAFTATTVLTLALAAGANAAIFTVVHGVLLKPLPFPDVDRLVAVWPGRFQSNADLLYTREHGRMFSSVAAAAPGWSMSLTGDGEPTRVTVARVSGNLFETFGTEPLLGRWFTEESSRQGAANVVVLDHAFWMSRFGGNPSIVGRTMQLDGDPVQVIAVMPPTFQVFGLRTDAYTPFPMDASAWYHRLSFSFYAARLAPGVSLEQGNADYRALIQRLRIERKYPDAYGRDAAVIDMRTALVGDVSASLVVLAAAVGLILLIAGANVGTLQLSRAVARSKDVAIRSALGATRGRIVRQLLAENALLAISGGLFGVALAWVLLPALITLLPPGTPRVAEIAIDVFVAGAVLVATLLVGLSVGVGPALGSSRLGAPLLLRAMTSSESRGAKRLRAALVSAEVALAVVLTIGAGLMLQTMWRLGQVDPGFTPEGVLTAHVQPTGAKYRSLLVPEYYDEILERVRALPGVTAAGAVQHLPFSGYSWNIPFEAEGHIVPPGAAPPSAGSRLITPGYFAAIGQPILAGRDLEPGDAARLGSVVVGQRLATAFFGSANAAIGRTIRPRAARGAGESYTIVGVVGDVRHSALTDVPGYAVYLSVSKHSIPAMMLAVRTDGDPRALVPLLREGIRSVDRDVPLSDLETMDAKIGRSLGQPRLLLSLLGAFAALGVLLALLGVYGVVAYSVAQRWRELGIMVALGAERGRIMRSVLREAVVYGALGLALGVPSAMLGSRLLRNLVFGVSPTDPSTYAAIVAMTLITVVAAAVLPALRAARVDPVTALKQA
ncbi:MAG TPA: ABC transporter permease [Vicinamibacterales bacterium]|nr:ABC transporter permease [Vicinamibacterales bacterium]